MNHIHRLAGNQDTPVRPFYRRRDRDENRYIWERDFPVHLQARRTARETILRLEFALSEPEGADFYTEIKSKLNGTLPLEVRFGQQNKPVFRVKKQGPAAKTLNAKSSQVAEFIAKRLSYNYIPAIRTDQEFLPIIGDMIQQELRVLEKDADYLKALQTVEARQAPVLEQLASRIREPLSEFLPNIKNVQIKVSASARRFAYIPDFSVLVDDGTPTSIEHKGDGVKSLAALGLLKNRLVKGDASIIAIEEPESHLHPAAIHQLNEVISSLATDNQVILTTHNGLFADRNRISANIIIAEGRATTAKNVKQVRDLLGIRASDNLQHARFVLVVEGTEDKTSLQSLLSWMSPTIARALKNNTIAIDPIGGAGNLPYALSQYKNALCQYHVVLDRDTAGEQAFENAKSSGLLGEKNTTFVICRDMGESELEDVYNVDCYSQAIADEFGVDLNKKTFRSNKKKWSARMKETFLEQGRRWDRAVEIRVKGLVAEQCSSRPSHMLNAHKGTAIHALKSAVEIAISGEKFP